jgi:CRISPR-associated protein Cst1
MENQDKYIELLPSNWLYNASVIGFLTSLEIIENKNIDEYFFKDGQVLLPKKVFSELDVEKRYFSDAKISSIVAKAPIYRNYLQTSDKVIFSQFVKSLENLEKIGKCSISSEAYNLPTNVIQQLKEYGLEMFLNRIENFSMIFHADLGPSLSMFPNAYWNIKQSNKICHLLAFLIIHQHLAFTSLDDWTKIFINAPSFKLMYELNKIINSSFEWRSDNNSRSLLAMSVIEYCAKTDATLGVWSGMNIEIVAVTKRIKENGKYDDIIEYYSLPFSVIRLISNKRIASLLSEIGEFKILNLVLDEKFKELIEIAYRILKISMKEDDNKGDKKFIDDTLFIRKNKSNKKAQRLVANKIMKLYALIEEQLKTE